MKILAPFKSLLLLFCLLSLTASALAEEVVSADLFPVNGVTLGKTSIDELVNTEATKLEQAVEADGLIKVDSVGFSYQDRVLTTLEIVKNETMPTRWKDAGFEWSLSYQEWTGLLVKLGFSINQIQAPTLQMEADHPVMVAEFEAYRPSGFPTVFNFSFTENRGTGVASKNVLNKISARYLRDFKGFTADQFKNQEPVLFDEAKRKALALSGIAAEINGLNHEKLELTVINQVNTDYWKKLLAEEWGITKRNQLLEKLVSLESKGDSKVYQDLVNILLENESLTINEMGKKLNYDPKIINRLHFIKEKRGIIGDRALRAWDYSRMALLCRIGYQVGFLTANEAWTYLQRGLTKIESMYHSWEDYAANYLLGMIFLAAESGREAEEGNQGLQAYAKLVWSKGNAWQLSWNRKDTANQISGNALQDVLCFPSPHYQAWTNYLSGWQSYEEGEFNEALSYFNNGLILDPEFMDLWLSIGMVYKAQFDFQKAIGAFGEYLKKYPDAYLPRIYLGEAYEKDNQLREALDEYNKAVDLDDSKPDGFIGLGRVAINSGNYQLAVSYLRIAESLHSNKEQGIFYTLYLLGYSYYKAEKFDNALSYFIRAYSNYQDNKYLNYYLGICYLYNQNISLAKTYLSHAEKLGLTIPAEIKTLLDHPNPKGNQ